MTKLHSNLKLLEDAAARLKELTAEVVFVGGATLDLLISDKGASPTRATIDVDVIAEITTYKDYVSFSSRLREHGFSEDSRENAPVCRWVHGDLLLDVMPLNESVLGFTNIWYTEALKTANLERLPSGAIIRVISPPFFLGTKMEAFRGRGLHDFFGSHDMEDFISVLDGRESILDEISRSPRGLISYLSQAATNLLTEPRFMDALPGYFAGDDASQQRTSVVLARLNSMAVMQPC